MNVPVFELQDVYYSYLGKFPALCGINLTVNPSEKIAIIGANGTGKSTLLTLLDGLVFPDRGIVKVMGKELRDANFTDEEYTRFFRSKIGFVFQNPDIQLFCPTVKEDIVFGPLQLGINPAEINRRLDNITELLNLQPLLSRAPFQLSIGEKRKVAIAAVLAIGPEIIILD